MSEQETSKPPTIEERVGPKCATPLEHKLLRRILALRGDLERIALGYTDDPEWIKRECKEALDADERWHYE